MRLALNILLLILTSLAMCAAQDAGGRVHGQVWSRPFIEEGNVFGRTPLPGCEVIFHSKTVDRKALTDTEGNYAGDLPPGNYSVNASCPLSSQTWEYHSSSRADFEMKPDSSPLVNMM